MRVIAVLLLSGVFFATGLLAEGGAATFAESEAIAKLQAMDLFPDLEKDGSELNRAVAAEVARIERTDPGFFKQPGWPVFVARHVANRIGLKPRTVAEIRASLEEKYGGGSEVIRHLHGIRIVEAKFSTGTGWVDVSRKIAARVSTDGLVVDCDRSLAPTLADERDFDQQSEEGDADYWKRQREMLLTAANARGGKPAFRVQFELHSEQVSIDVRDGERLTISGDGNVTVSAIAPPAGSVREKSPVTNPGKKRKQVGDSSPLENGGIPTKGTTGAREPFSRR